ncbi:hypothetical protein ILUMI_11494 [Ignelater luminosus]|uniref:Tc1-like transposase DDE domain-containing protein n=1 Tax=Ignelater luminosus TaxID=2038154 RepID=A0A8K0CYB3_IGNLU|nr:hypothetical protein ILUMI_11494 [Ignelater luminosus]
MKKQRLKWAKERENWVVDDWKSYFLRRVQRRAGERYNSECILSMIQRSPYAMVWGAITEYGVGKIIMIEGMVTQQKINLNIQSLSWPGNSPDLNPIDNLWSLIGKRMKERKTKPSGKLKNVILSVCEVKRY